MGENRATLPDGRTVTWPATEARDVAAERLHGLWMTTYSGRRFHFDHPHADMVSTADIAMALARTARFGGHTRTRFPYSVAQHSLILADALPRELRLEALLHAAAEAYLGDLLTPVKRFMPALKDLEATIFQAITERYGLLDSTCWEAWQLISHTDKRLLEAEKRDMLPSTLEPGQPHWDVTFLGDLFPPRIEAWREEHAYAAYQDAVTDECFARGVTA